MPEATVRRIREPARSMVLALVLCLLAAPACAQPAAPSNLGVEGSAVMAIAPVANTVKSSTNTNAITTDAIDTTGATLLVLGIASYAAVGPGTISDSKSNTWVATGVSQAISGATRVDVYYVKSPTVGSGHTFSGGATGGYPSVFVVSFSGTNTPANRDQENQATEGPPNSLTAQPGSVTPTENDEVLVTFI